VLRRKVKIMAKQPVTDNNEEAKVAQTTIEPIEDEEEECCCFECCCGEPPKPKRYFDSQKVSKRAFNTRSRKTARA
jgi:hypothetical protein